MRSNANPHLDANHIRQAYHRGDPRFLEQSKKEHLATLKSKFGTRVRLLGKYTNRITLTEYTFICGHTGKMRPTNIERRSSDDAVCPSCARKAGSTVRVTREEILARIKEHHGTKIQLVGQVTRIANAHRFRCNECQHSWKTALMHVISKTAATGCPRCAMSRVSAARGRKAFKFKTITLGACVFKVQGYEPQALEWILRNTSITAKDIRVDTSGEVPTFVYKLGRRKRTYFPDIFVPKRNLIVEVKSTYTLGLDSGRDWKKNQAKAKAVVSQGYKFAMLVMDARGGRMFRMPKDWYSRTRASVLTELAMSRADVRPATVKSNPRVHTKVSVIAQKVVAAIQALPKPRSAPQVVAAVERALEGLV